MTKTSSLAVLALVVAASPLAARAQSAPTTQQQQQQQQQAPPQNRSPFRSAGDRYFDGRGFGGGGGGGDGMRQRMEWRRGDGGPGYPLGGGGGGGGGRAVEQQDYLEPSPEEWKDVEEFMLKHSPKRLERLGDIDEDRQQAIRRMLVTRYRALEELKDQDPELYKIRLDRMLIEDDVFGLGWELNHQPGDDKAEDLRKQLREKLRLLFKSGLQERAHRLKHWESVLERHRQSLKEDEAKLDSAVERYMSDVRDQRWPRFLRPLPQQRPSRAPSDDDEVLEVPADPPARGEEGAPE